ncbi:glycine zipper 2TM domain-containing protein [Shewanella litorisediminis]|uniref:Glycine zipper 2TM domain-containing protein n=1 Tax=Shewanella litorisediminis TaxID=1173586 RepID=A0ABX7FZ93_9GAMM|nr:glycine zipper 2TM domain-containing protein [Shewanella litorisediminis]MCL2918690.1 glycine zipper 2TM domain-containing protein [Shewanella litorisediminis]QRH00336.1 glycine zipper 2TM domain-containing protein [Shewanella litorisediminis]
MLKPALCCLVFLVTCFSGLATGGYERNQAMAVEKVLYGELTSVRRLTQQELVADQHRGWRTFGGALLGGVIGHQFGGGSGQDVATVLGALLGGAIANQAGGDKYRELHLIELMIRQEDDTQIMILQDEDSGMPLKAGDEVRVVYLQGMVRVDKAM